MARKYLKRQNAQYGAAMSSCANANVCEFCSVYYLLIVEKQWRARLLAVSQWVKGALA